MPSPLKVNIKPGNVPVSLTILDRIANSNKRDSEVKNILNWTLHIRCNIHTNHCKTAFLMIFCMALDTKLQQNSHLGILVVCLSFTFFQNLSKHGSIIAKKVVSVKQLFAHIKNS